jgi:hypothetical protein
VRALTTPLFQTTPNSARYSHHGRSIDTTPTRLPLTWFPPSPILTGYQASPGSRCTISTDNTRSPWGLAIETIEITSPLTCLASGGAFRGTLRGRLRRALGEGFP